MHKINIRTTFHRVQFFDSFSLCLNNLLHLSAQALESLPKISENELNGEDRKMRIFEKLYNALYSKELRIFD